MKHWARLGGLIAALSGGCVMDPQEPAAGGAAGAGDEKVELVCETERPTGSSISRRVCRRKHDGVEATNDQRYLQTMQTNSSQVPGGGFHPPGSGSPAGAH